MCVPGNPPDQVRCQPRLLLVFLVLLLAAAAALLALPLGLALRLRLALRARLALRLRLALRARHVLRTRHFWRTSAARIRGRTAALDPRFPVGAWRAGVNRILPLRSAALDPRFPAATAPSDSTGVLLCECGRPRRRG